MPAINVARTDTFEQQRVKINEIGSQVFGITQGGSDLATGNLRLGDGTLASPSLAFTSDSQLGIYKSDLSTFGFASVGKRIFDISSTELISYKNFKIQKNTLSTGGLTLLNSGSGYDPGNYLGVSILGGSGDLATIDLVIESFSGSITNAGRNYTPGSFAGIRLEGGSGTGAEASFTVEAVDGTILNNGSGYGDGNTTLYEFIFLTGGSGTGAQASFFVDTVSGEIVSINITLSGSGYQIGDILSVNNADFDGSGSGFQFEITSEPGIVKNLSFTQKGSGYSANDVLTLPGPVNGVSATLDSNSSVITVSSVSGIVPGSSVTQSSGTGQIDSGTTVQFIDLITNTITISANPLVSGSAVLNFIPPYGNTQTTDFEYTINNVGVVDSFTVNLEGNGYAIGDLLTVSALNLVQPITYLVSAKSTDLVTFVESIPAGYFSVGDSITNGLLTGEIYQVNTSGGNLISILCESIQLQASDTVNKVGDVTNYTVNVAINGYRFFIDTGNGPELTPDLTLYVDNTYIFDLSDSSNSIHSFALSEYRDGRWEPSYVQNINTTLDSSTNLITVSTTANILEGMEVIVTSIGGGGLPVNTIVESVIDSTTIQLSNSPTLSGAATLSFRGVEYTDGVITAANSITLKVTNNTPTLYYYCKNASPNHADMGGVDGLEATITIDPNNPKVFGSGLSLRVDALNTTDIINQNVDTGKIDCLDIASVNSQFTSTNVTGTLTAPTISGNTISLYTINSQANLEINATSTNVQSNLNVGSNLTVERTSGNLTTSGVLKSTSSINVNDKLFITNNTISSPTGTDIIIQPPSGRITKVDSTSALVVPSGTTAQRPGATLATNGSVRFNTTTGQYEGYSASTSSWSSLGGVRDIDGNTYILAELTTGANDNTLWFYNDNVNSLRLTTGFLDFRNVKKISSGKLGLPSFVLWSANTPVTVGQYVKYRNNLYEVTATGTTGGVGTEPTHVSGVANSGTAQFTWYSLAVSPLEFTEIEELRVGPNKDCPLIINAELKLSNNTISTLVEDLVLTPNSGKKVTVNATSSLVVPVGNTNQRGSAAQGSVRYNTTISQFEGYSGANWSSLGGVRDVDGNTYIIPETAPGANENILYFYNNNVNTLKLTETELDFTSIDTVTTSGGNSLALNTEILTLNSSDTTIDNTDSSSTFISTTKQYLDLGLSSGLNVDPVLRLDDQGDVYLNVGFGTGTFNGVKIFDGDLKDFELADYAVKTNTFSLTKGSVNSTSSVLYSPANAKGCKVTVVSKSSSGKKSMAEYSVIDNGTDIFFTEIGSLNTSAEGFSAAFDFTPGNETRITLTLSNDHTAGDVVQFTVLTQTIK
jgi:hypothetical protein